MSRLPTGIKRLGRTALPFEMTFALVVLRSAFACASETSAFSSSTTATTRWCTMFTLVGLYCPKDDLCVPKHSPYAVFLAYLVSNHFFCHFGVWIFVTFSDTNLSYSHSKFANFSLTHFTWFLYLFHILHFLNNFSIRYFSSIYSPFPLNFILFYVISYCLRMYYILLYILEYILLKIFNYEDIID